MEIPKQFLQRMEQLLGEEFSAFLESYNQPKAQALRLHPGKTDIKEMQRYFALEPVPWTPQGFYYDGKQRPGKHPFHEAGLYYIQEPSAMVVGELAAPQPGQRVLDLCAAPGGKTTHLAVQMAGEGILISNEIHPARAKILSQNVERMGLPNVIVCNETPQRLAQRLPGWFDVIVVDAPCSGEGMFRKDEVACQEWSMGNVELCAQRQAEILDCAVHMLKPGGKLVYSTCTFAPQEDECCVAALLERWPEMQLCVVPLREGWSTGRPEWCTDGPKELKHTIRLWPHLLRGEGHFAAVLQKNGGEEQEIPLQKPCSQREIPPEWVEFAKQTLADISWESLMLFGDQLYALPQQTPQLNGLKVLRPGLHLGTRKKKRFEPAHALALALRPEQAVSCLNLPLESTELSNYLMGQTIPAEGKGWILVTVEGHPLGWGKATGGVLKNHYPKGLRWTEPFHSAP